jgi:hypothetical protein
VIADTSKPMRLVLTRARALIVLSLVLAMGLAPAAQDLNKARALLEQALEALRPTPAAITTPEALDRALAAAAPGAVLTLSPALVYPQSLTLRQAVTLQSDVPLARMDRTTPLPSFRGGLTIAGDGITLVGVEVRHPNPLTDIVLISGAHVTLDRVRVLGDPQKGAKRGIAANSNGDVTIRRSYVDDAFQSYPGNDSQAIGAWDLAPGLLIDDNYLAGGSETIMIGGADPASEARSPRDIVIRKNTITKNPAWQTQAIGVKNTLELKNARQVVIEDNVIEYAWGGKGQDGYLLMLTVRNQGGKAPYSTIQDVTIRRNRYAHGAAAINILGRDNNQPSTPMARVTITEEAFTDLDPTKYSGSSRMILINGGPSELAITTTTFSGAGLTSALYFAGGPPLERFTFSDNTYPKTRYGIFGSSARAGVDAQGVPYAWTQYVASGTLEGNRDTP